MEYRQEYYKGEAEDRSGVITVGSEQVEVPFGFFDDVVMTRDLVPLEPKVQELKFYARDVGPVMSVHTDGLGGGSPRQLHARFSLFAASSDSAASAAASSDWLPAARFS